MDPAQGTDSQDSDDLMPPGISASEFDAAKIKIPTKKLVCTPSSSPVTTRVSSKGIENAKKRLRAFSIQKKSPLTAVKVPKPINTGKTTVLIGKLSSLKTTPVTPKTDAEEDQKKPPKPPKPGSSRANIGYCHLQKCTISEIEDMKRKMELIELGIPLGLICPSSTSEKAMPTKAMPPIKTFLDPSKVDELIREAKKAKADGKEFKFDYNKILPDYDNPFQRKRDEATDKKEDEEYPGPTQDTKDERDRKDTKKFERRPPDRYDSMRIKYKDSRNKYRSKSDDRKKGFAPQKDAKETDVNLNDYLVCDSWSLDNEDKVTSPQMVPAVKVDVKSSKDDGKITEYLSDRRTSKPKMEPLKPVIDSFKFEIDPNEDEIMDMFDVDCVTEKLVKSEPKRDLYDSPMDLKLFDYDQDMSKDGVIDANDDNFLESVINEIKQENMSDDGSQDKGLVEYDSPKDDDEDYDSKPDTSLGSVTPELDDRMRDLQSSQQSHYSDGYRSTESYKSVESGYKSTESGYKSTESLYKSPQTGYKQNEGSRKATEGGKSNESTYRSTDTAYSCNEPSYKTEPGYKPSDSYKPSKGYKSPDVEYKPKDGRRRSDSRQSECRQSTSYIDKDTSSALVPKMSKSTVESLETWSFVLKICQPLLFRHDKNKCYKETLNNPKIWYTVNPKMCTCVKDRSVVYEELEMCKMSLVDRVYGCDQIPDGPCPHARAWYPRLTGCMTTAQAPQLATDWETDDIPPRSTTPQTEELCIDQEYQRFMKAVWPDVVEAQKDTSRSTTPIQEEIRKKKKTDDPEKDLDYKKKAKKMKLSNEGWSQESDFEDDVDKSKKLKTVKEKSRKRKRTLSMSNSQSSIEDDSKKKKKLKKMESKKTKAKSTKSSRVSKKIKKKFKEKQKKKRKLKTEKISEESEEAEKEIKKEKKIKKNKQLKRKKILKKNLKPISSSSSSSTSTSSTDSESELDKKKKTKRKEVEVKKKKKDKKKKRKESSDSSQSEDLFDVNILNNIKTERLTDDEKNQQQMIDFSPRRQKPREREIINVKELQNDFAGYNIHIKQEKDDPNEDSEINEKVSFNLSDIQPPPEPVVLTEMEIKTCPEETPIESVPEHLPSTIPLPEEIQVPETLPQHVEPVKIQTVTPLPVPRQISVPQPVPQQISVPQPVPHQITVPVPQPVPQQITVPVPQQITVPVPQPVPEPKAIDTVKTIEVKAVQSYSYRSVSSQNEFYAKAAEDSDDKYADGFHQEYEMYEHMAMAYQSDVANQRQASFEQPPSGRQSAQRIETVVHRRGEIKCDWRAGDSPAALNQNRPSRWGLKPGEVNIVLTGGPAVEPVPPPQQYPIRSVVDPVYKIQSLSTRNDSNAAASMGYDEAYLDTYGASDLLQYGDCFAAEQKRSDASEADAKSNLQSVKSEAQRLSSLDERIDRALRGSALGDVAKDPDDKEAENDIRDRGILVTRSLASDAGRGAKRVSFADGYQPGQDSDTEEPPIKRKKKSRRYGCAWPCPATHPDHVPLWDALPPPPPPPSPPPTMPHGQPIMPHGQQQGMPHNQQGQPIMPLGQSIMPLGQPIMPLGQQPVMPHNQPGMQHGQPVMPHGQPVMPHGQPVMSLGQPVMPHGPTTVPLGQPPPSMRMMRAQLRPPTQLVHHQLKFDPNAAMPAFMPPEPPPGIISFP